jgi:5-methylcytosine-specific restriction protein A
MLGEALERILLEFPIARQEPFAQNPTVAFISRGASKTIADIIATITPQFLCVGSAGKGNFATVPWLSVFDPLVTTTATQGYYVVYLFNADARTVYLSLNQGTTSIRAEFGEQTHTILRERAQIIRTRLRDYITQHHFDTTPIALGSTKNLPKDYEAGHAMGRAYSLDSLPTEQSLRDDLLAIVQAYRALTFRGGLDTALDSELELTNAAGLSDSQKVVENRRYKFHKRIERNAKGAKLAKQVHGTVCQACCFDFSEYYGDLGQGFIEAHHLLQLNQLEEDTPVVYDVATQFAVLCSNCHRMIHKTDDPSNLAAFKELLLRPFCTTEPV